MTHTPTVPLPRDEHQAVALLRAGIPLSLLFDLAGADPHSEELYALEQVRREPVLRGG